MRPRLLKIPLALPLLYVRMEKVWALPRGPRPHVNRGETFKISNLRLSPCFPPGSRKLVE